MLAALILYGLIEYNLADAEIVILYSLAMGMSTFRAGGQEASETPA